MASSVENVPQSISPDHTEGVRYSAPSDLKLLGRGLAAHPREPQPSSSVLGSLASFTTTHPRKYVLIYTFLSTNIQRKASAIRQRTTLMQRKRQ